MQPPMKCVYFYVLALTLAFPRDVRHVRPVVESVTSWGARCTRRVRVVPDVPLALNKRKRARELLSQHIFGHNMLNIVKPSELSTFVSQPPPQNWLIVHPKFQLDHCFISNWTFCNLTTSQSWPILFVLWSIQLKEAKLMCLITNSKVCLFVCLSVCLSV